MILTVEMFRHGHVPHILSFIISIVSQSKWNYGILYLAQIENNIETA